MPLFDQIFPTPYYEPVRIQDRGLFNNPTVRYNKLMRYLKRNDYLNIEASHLRTYFRTIEGLSKKLESKQKEERTLRESKASSVDTALNIREYLDFTSTVDKQYQVDLSRGAAINVWQIAGLKRDEVRNTAVLAWWFDQQGSHALGGQLLRQLISDHFTNIESSLAVRSISTPYKVKPESLPLGDLEDRIDIEISSNDILLFWEVKIDAPEGKNAQLQRYKTLLDTKSTILGTSPFTSLIYLTTESQNYKSTADYHLKWSDICNSFLNVYYQLSDEFYAKPLLLQYCDYIRQF